MERIANAWRLSKASWQVLAKDRKLIAVPVVAGVAAILAFAVFALPGVLLLPGSDAEAPSNVALWIFLAAGAIASTWMMVLGQAAVVAGAAERMEGGNPDIGSAFAAARGRAFRLLEWAVLATVVSFVLDVIRQRFGLLGNIVSWIGGVAFQVMSFLALPVIVFENVGAIEGFKRSAALLKRTWGEQLTFSFGMGILSLLAVLPGVLVGGLLLATGLLPLQVIGGIGLVGWVVLVLATTTALSAVFKAALYRYANNLPVDPAFDAEILSNAFRHR